MEKKSAVKLSLIVLAICGAVAAVSAVRPDPEPVLDRAMRAKTIDALAAKLNAHYVFPNKATQMAAVLQRRQQEGRYDGIDNGYRLAKQLTADLHDVARDLHMKVGYHPAMTDEAEGPAPDLDFLTRLVQRRPAADRGVELVGRLGDKIGYLKISSFPHASLMREKFAEAMDELAGTEGLIMDLRGHRGGDPQAVPHLISYFVDRRTRLNDIWERDTGNTIQHWTQEELAGPRYGGKKPVMILVDSGTGSAGEDVAYTMQALKRATVIGEPTWGGAHPTQIYPLGGHFYASIPNQRSISPITGTNWEGTGVKPDVATTRDRTLAVAKDLMRRRLRESTPLVASINH
ncbi:S41 family peptidase [Massilia sp. G4R7]|uniref:S41 family peptidase n=1 Tax=Massilia phyllostachyos TaxID=2898585 RepID=A0ABS8QBP9_9BURK|nr:S41 family peptidase [Massilia phyllostachyos]MCD2519188.1 S41 family peptidase [Massilia phyllostachyos]